MGKFRKTDRLGVDDEDRRDFLKLMVLTGGMMGVTPWKVFEVMEETLGTAHAQAAAASTIAKSLHINAGTGAIGRFYLLWPHVEACVEANTPNSNVLGRDIAITRASAELKVGTNKPLYTVLDSPWKDLPGSRQVTALMGGYVIQHAETAITNTQFDTGGAGTTRGQASLFAAAAVLQNRESPTAIPVMTVDAIRDAGQPQPFGGAPGSGNIPVARARNFGGLVDMVASEAAKPGKVIARAENAALYSRYYDAVKRLNRASTNHSYQTAYKSADQSLSVMVKQLAQALQPSDDEVDRYLGLTNQAILDAMMLGANSTVAQRLAKVGSGSDPAASTFGSALHLDFARTLILAAKAYALGVTNMVMMPAFNDDPHGILSSTVGRQNQTFMTGNALNEFMRDCSAAPDPTSGTGGSVGQNVVVHIYGDNCKSPLSNRLDFNDSPQRNHNVSFVLGQGWLKTGWFGGLVRNNGQLVGSISGQGEVINLYNPLDPAAPNFKVNDQNDPGAQTCARLGPYTAAAVLYAITNGQVNKWREFYSGDAIPGLINFDRG